MTLGRASMEKAKSETNQYKKAKTAKRCMHLTEKGWKMVVRSNNSTFKVFPTKIEMVRFVVGKGKDLYKMSNKEG